MELLAWGGAVAFMALTLLFPGLMQYGFLTALVYCALWTWVVVSSKERPRTLWRYIAEWILSLICILLFFLFAKGNVDIPFFFAKVWMFFNMPFMPSMLDFSWLYYVICIFILILCSYQLVRNHRINKEWW